MQRVSTPAATYFALIALPVLGIGISHNQLLHTRQLHLEKRPTIYQ